MKCFPIVLTNEEKKRTSGYHGDISEEQMEVEMDRQAYLRRGFSRGDAFLYENFV
jgi:hypothetical protein